MNECQELGIPHHLWLQSRPVVSYFSPNEFLYRRFNSLGTVTNFIKDEKISVSIFELKDDSYNRSSLCKSEIDVLFNDRMEDAGEHYVNHGILSIRIGDIENYTFAYKSGNEINTCQMLPRHVPQKCNYSHSELWFYINGNRIIDGKPKSAKKIFRKKLLNFVRIMKLAA